LKPHRRGGRWGSVERLCPSHIIVDILCIETLNFAQFCVAEFDIYCMSKQAYIHVAVMVCGRHGFGPHSPPCGRHGLISGPLSFVAFAVIALTVIVCGRHGFGRHRPPCGRHGLILGPIL